MSVTATAVTPAATPTVTPETTDAATAPGAPAATQEDAGTGAPALTLEQLTAKLEEMTKHSRTWESRAKENKEAREKLDALELEKLTDAERVQKELDELRKDRDQTARALLVSEVATAKNVPAALLQGDTQEALEAYAATLLEWRGDVKPPANDSAAAGSQGDAIAPPAQLTSTDGMTREEIRQAVKDGRFSKTLTGK